MLWGFRGRTLWHRSNLLWGLGHLVARHQLVDDGLWGLPFVCLVRRVEVGGCIDNQHAQVVEQPMEPGGYLLFNLGVLVRVGDTGVDHCSPSQCRVRQQPYAKTTLHKICNINTMHKKSPHAYKLIPLDVVIILKNFSARIFVIFVLYISFVIIFVCRVTLYFNSTMAEANGIRDLPKQGIQSILEGFSIDDSERSLPQVPNETLGLSSISQTLSSSFNRL